jgi:hypothetical protein
LRRGADRLIVFHELIETIALVGAHRGAAVDDLARLWAYTGMQTGEKKPKPAFEIRDA